MAPLNPEKLAKKGAYLNRLKRLLSLKNVLIIHADHVGSKQMQEIRIALRGKAEVLMGKNTMIRTAIKQYVVENAESDIDKLLSYVKGNIGFVFCKNPDDLIEIKKIIQANKVPAMAKTGVIAPCDVTIPAGPTGLDPSQTSFFQALNIATKIVKGQIEISSDVPLIREGIKVQASEQVLLSKLNIRPFGYGLIVTNVFDGTSIYDVSVLDIKDSSIINMITHGIRNLAAFSRQVGIPTQASIIHSIGSAFKNCVSLISLMDDVNFHQAAMLKDFLKDPSKFAASKPVDSSPKSVGGGGSGAKAKASAPVVEEEEDEEAANDFSLFD